MKIFWMFGGKHNARIQHHDPDVGHSHLIIWVSFLSLVIFLVWAYFAKLDQVTRAPGSVIASSRTQVIQSQEGGILEELLVKEGDTVEAGQVLAKIERTRAETAYLEMRAKAVGLAATAARLKAEIFGGEPRFSPELENYPEFRINQLSLLNKRRAALNEDIEALLKMQSLAQQELEMNLPLLKSGDVSRTEVLRLQRQLADIKSQITNKRNKYSQDAQAELSKTEEDLESAMQTMAQRKGSLEQTELRAPVRGVVKNVRITTQKGVIRPGDEVMNIVPIEDDLVVEAKVSPSDIAFLKIGQSATIKIDAYDYTVYGVLPGTLTFISADTMSENLRPDEKPYYRVHIRTKENKFKNKAGRNIDIIPGMTATVEIKTGQKTVFAYLLKPLVKTVNESMGER
jgi:adhesin transport system membrane fusion protein